jgi:hypothetical protein
MIRIVNQSKDVIASLHLDLSRLLLLHPCSQDLLRYPLLLFDVLGVLLADGEGSWAEDALDYGLVDCFDLQQLLRQFVDEIFLLIDDGSGFL